MSKIQGPALKKCMGWFLAGSGLSLARTRPRVPRNARSLVPSARINTQNGLYATDRDISSFFYSALAFAPTSDAPSGRLALAVFFGLPTALWLYKCLMMVLFQRKIIYMGYVPPGAREERLEDQKVPPGVECEEIHITGEKGASLHGILVNRQYGSTNLQSKHSPTIVFLYLQGNAGTPLARLPLFEKLLCGTHLPGAKRSQPDSLETSAIFALAPRSFWKSTPRRPTEHGILSDYGHALSYITRRFPSSSIVLYGHSLGGAAAVCLAASIPDDPRYTTVRGLILENPFASIPEMVKALYPQRWLPYHYLGGLAFDRWDAVGAMRAAQSKGGSLLARLSRSMLVVLSKKDEIVPYEQGLSLFEIATQKGGDGGDEPGSGTSRMVMLQSALHENAWTERRWRTEIELYVRSIHN